MPCFVMNQTNLNLIRSNYYWLLKKGFTLDELKNLELNEFRFYIRKVHEEFEAEQEANRKQMQKMQSY